MDGLRSGQGKQADESVETERVIGLVMKAM
jgi:hypothetical protein